VCTTEFVHVPTGGRGNIRLWEEVYGWGFNYVQWEKNPWSEHEIRACRKRKTVKRKGSLSRNREISIEGNHASFPVPNTVLQTDLEKEKKRVGGRKLSILGGGGSKKRATKQSPRAIILGQSIPEKKFKGLSGSGV